MMKTCVNGHLFDDKNTRLSMRNGMKLRVCRECQRIRLAAFHARQYMKRNGT